MPKKKITIDGVKKFRINFNIGKSKYTISTHDGIQTHKDGSEFFGIETFTRKRDFEKEQKRLAKEGYLRV